MYFNKKEISKMVNSKYCIIKWTAKLSDCSLLINEYTNTTIIHNNKRAMLKAKVLKTNSFDPFSPIVKIQLIKRVVIAKNKVGIQKCGVAK